MALDNKELKVAVAKFPQDPGVYLMKNQGGAVIYVGKAKNLRARVKSYFQKLHESAIKTKFLVSHIDHIDYILTETEVEAFLLEASLIKKHKPRYNIRLKDDRSYPYIRCSIGDSYPRFYLVRKVKNDGAVYFGPYTSGQAVRESIRFINHTFKIRDCQDSYMKGRGRACLSYQIGRCTAPCVAKITYDDYSLDVRGALDFLKGRSQQVVDDLQLRMQEASKIERFEAAGKYRDSLAAVEAIWEKQTVISSAAQDKDQDVICYVGDNRGTLVECLHIRKGRIIGHRSYFLAKLNTKSPDETPKEWLTSFLNQYYVDNFIPDEIILPEDLGGDIYRLLGEVFKLRQKKEAVVFVHTLGEAELDLMALARKNADSHFGDHVLKLNDKKKSLELIQLKLKLPELPRRIECFDISNFQGADSVASQVVFEEGLPKTEDYRRYKIKTVDGPNDFASMKEVLGRRLAHKEWEEPNLVVVDGGKGQLSVALEVFKELGCSHIPVIGLAKARTKGHFSDESIAGTEERVFIPGRQNPVIFPANSDALHILVGLRDEAHRFAITYHRKLKRNASLASVLDLITGLGEKRKIKLLKKFESVEKLAKASPEDLMAIKGFHRVLSERILIQLNEVLGAAVTQRKK